MDDENELSPIERMALSARQLDASGELPPSLKPISLRVPLHLLAGIDAFVSLTGQSRNTAMINLLDAGIYAVRQQLDDSDIYDIARDSIYQQYLED